MKRNEHSQETERLICMEKNCTRPGSKPSYPELLDTSSNADNNLEILRIVEVVMLQNEIFKEVLYVRF